MMNVLDRTTHSTVHCIHTLRVHIIIIVIVIIIAGPIRPIPVDHIHIHWLSSIHVPYDFSGLSKHCPLYPSPIFWGRQAEIMGLDRPGLAGLPRTDGLWE
ncbi:hypothetical protein I7I53_07728 [Histoplasma capsulatum var. duboisii H88]|uniref:Uncharacterized protein n=1 Tax=Ajellomyces capsulatus (strain H88) TaxID=544711 RepID=A0A8A1LHQ3_AJEC8|nr:hypothetical protein I7I53_07728 [Histoplasma capsulatum var. duboisii H88]